MFVWMSLGAMAAPPDADELREELGISVGQLISALPACGSTQGDGRLDLDKGCVNGLCLRDNVEGIEAECSISETNGNPLCSPEPGVTFWDHRADPRRMSPQVRALYLRPDFTGKTRDGLGLGTSMACWLAALGTPDDVSLSRVGARFTINELHWDEPKVKVQADDGRVSRMTIQASRSR